MDRGDGRKIQKLFRNVGLKTRLKNRLSRRGLFVLCVCVYTYMQTVCLDSLESEGIIIFDIICMMIIISDAII